MTVIGLDLGTKCGWAICQDGRIASSDTRHFDRGEYGYGALFNQFRKLLMDLHVDQSCVWAYESPHFRGGPATRITVGMASHLMELAHHWGEPIISVHTATLKKWATGSGRAGKREMMDRALGALVHQHAKVPNQCPDLTEHEADAILVALWAAEQQ